MRFVVKIYNGADGSKILLIRPGATEFDEQGRITGTLDLPLSELGRQQAEKLSEESTDFEVAAIYSSPNLAAQQTAEIVAKPHGRKVKVKKAIRNIDHGLWQGKEIQELRTTQPKIAKQWEEHPETVTPPGGESVEESVPRVGKFLAKLQKRYKSGTIVIVVADPLAKVISGLLTNQTVRQSDANPDEPPSESSACGKMDVLPLELTKHFADVR